MKRLIAAVCLSFAACTTLSLSGGIRKYDQLESLVGQEVTLVGYWSSQHEAIGIYFGNRYYRDAPKQCVRAEPNLSVGHGKAVRVSGMLEKSRCGEELICLTVCQPYVLKNAHLAK